MGVKELQNKLQDDYNCTIGYDTVWRGKEKGFRSIVWDMEIEFSAAI
jgi:hypothetical protein